METFAHFLILCNIIHVVIVHLKLLGNCRSRTPRKRGSSNKCIHIYLFKPTNCVVFYIRKGTNKL